MHKIVLYDNNTPPPPQPNPTQYTYTHLKSTIKEIDNLRICTLHFGRSRASDGIIQNPEEGRKSKQGD